MLIWFKFEPNILAQIHPHMTPPFGCHSLTLLKRKTPVLVADDFKSSFELSHPALLKINEYTFLRNGDQSYYYIHCIS